MVEKEIAWKKTSIASEFEPQSCRCACGKSAVIVKAKLRMRYYCHCLICQEICQSDISDNTALRFEEVEITTGSDIGLKKYEKNGVVERGVCDSLKKHSGVFSSQVIMIPSMMFSMLRQPRAADA